MAFSLALEVRRFRAIFQKNKMSLTLNLSFPRNQNDDHQVYILILITLDGYHFDFCTFSHMLSCFLNSGNSTTHGSCLPRHAYYIKFPPTIPSGRHKVGDGDVRNFFHIPVSVNIWCCLVLWLDFEKSFGLEVDFIFYFFEYFKI